MRSQKGITIMSLAIYVISFLMVTVLIGMITTFFYRNINMMDTGISNSVSYNKLNAYMLNEVKRVDRINVYDRDIYNDAQGTTITESFITFEYDNKTVITFVQNGKTVYYCKSTLMPRPGTDPVIYDLNVDDVVKLCENVEDNGFKAVLSESAGKKLVQVLLKLEGNTYTTEYVLGG